MHHVAFSSKRTFHGFLRVTRRAFASYGLTAARFDLLYVIAGHKRKDAFRPASTQLEIRRALGVTAPVVSRMVRALERLGWVTRTRCERDGRQRVIELTERGFSLFRTTRHAMLRAAERIVCRVIGYGRRCNPRRRLAGMLQLDDWFGAFRTELTDRATLYYPWGHPDD